MILGTGGSGTRAVASLALEAGYYMGSNLNPAGDSLDLGRPMGRWPNRYLRVSNWVEEIWSGSDRRRFRFPPAMATDFRAAIERAPPGPRRSRSGVGLEGATDDPPPAVRARDASLGAHRPPGARRTGHGVFEEPEPAPPARPEGSAAIREADPEGARVDHVLGEAESCRRAIRRALHRTPIDFSFATRTYARTRVRRRCGWWSSSSVRCRRTESEPPRSQIVRPARLAGPLEGP